MGLFLLGKSLNCMKKICLLLAAATMSASSLFAQQDPQFTQFMYDRLSINPGSAGANGMLCATLIGRQQWSGLTGQPNTGLLNLSGPIKSIKSGVGLTFIYDDIGPQTSTTARLSYAYHIKVGKATQLGLGVGIGIISSNLSSDWTAYDYNANGLTGIGTGVGDPLINQTGLSSTVFDASFGAYLYNPKYYVGASIAHINGGDFADMNIQLAQTLYFMGGYNFDLNPTWTVTPSFLVKTDLSSTQFDVNATVIYQNTIWAGVSYRLEDAIAPMAGYQYNFPGGKSVLKIGYSYDFTTSELNNYSSGSNELMINFCYKLAKPLPKRVYKNPRFL
jgi:type IX secretion system PorP/SprF family membrane protein